MLLIEDASTSIVRRALLSSSMRTEFLKLPCEPGSLRLAPTQFSGRRRLNSQEGSASPRKVGMCRVVIPRFPAVPKLVELLADRGHFIVSVITLSPTLLLDAVFFFKPPPSKRSDKTRCELHEFASRWRRTSRTPFEDCVGRRRPEIRLAGGEGGEKMNRLKRTQCGWRGDIRISGMRGGRR